MGLWEMNGTNVAAMVNLPNPPAAWQSVKRHPIVPGYSGSALSTADTNDSI